MKSESSTLQSSLGIYFIGLIIGVVSGLYWLFLPFGGPTIGFIVANSLKSTPQSVIKHGLAAGIIGAIGQVIAFIPTVGGYSRVQVSDLPLFFGIAAWTALTCLGTSAIVGRKRPSPEEIKAAQTAREAEREKKPTSFDIETTTNMLSFACPSCGTDIKVSLSAFSGSGTQGTRGYAQVTDSGRTAKVPTRIVNIILSLLVALGAGICSGNLMLSVIGAAIAISTMRYWAMPIASVFGKSVPIWLIKCPKCSSKSEVFQYQDTVNPTFGIALAGEEY